MKTILSHSDQPKRICSIDASTNSIAFAIFSDTKLKAFGNVNFQGTNTYAKVRDAARKSLQFFKKFNIDSIVIEHTVFINSPKTAADLALVQGAILGAAGIAGIKVAGSVNPISWQSYIGNLKLSVAEKKELAEQYPDKSKVWYQNRAREIRKLRTIHFVNTYYDNDVTDNDVADAIGIGHWAINKYSMFNYY
jgi:Holliday junction resolvasome RuvABC endonuclease subunit